MVSLGVLLIFLTLKFLWPLFRIGQEFLTGPAGVITVMSNQEAALKSDDGRTNILLLGIGDQNHDGPNLTDTMILVSVPATSGGTVTMVSIPRDIYLDSLGGKINSAYAIGEEKKAGGGLVLAKAAVSEVTGLPVHYAVRVDFSGFRQAIDLLGGIDITVDRELDDYQYPIDGKENDLCGLTEAQAAQKAATITNDATAAQAFPCRYEHLHFSPGPTHLDGTQALKFVRSRHAEGVEGSDFARSKRQQKVLLAVKAKVLSFPTLLSPQKLLSLYETFKSHLDTDIDKSEINSFLQLGLRLKENPVKNITLDDSLLINPPMDNRGWILVPPDGNFTGIHDFLRQQIFATGEGLLK